MSRCTLFLAVVVIPAFGFAQSGHGTWVPAKPSSQSVLVIGGDVTLAYAPEPGVMRERPRTAEPPDDQDDPAYASYKEGYQLILDERWAEAQKKFAELLAKYKKSKYRVDAEYWSAYALKHVNQAKAIRAYDDFLKRHPHSTYLDDVVADIAELEARAHRAGAAESTMVHFMVQPAVPTAPHEAQAAIRGLTFNIRRMERAMRRDFNPERINRLVVAPFPMPPDVGNGPIDKETKLKINTLRALGDIREDPRSFATLRDIALDRTQPVLLRSVALTELANFQNEDIVPVLVQVAEKDSDATVRSSAVYCIASAGRDREKTYQTLTQIYSNTPASRAGDREAIVTVIASVGRDQAVEFRASVARTDKNPDVALSAIDAIPETGADKDKVVRTLEHLYEETPAARTDQRETILYTVADVGNDRAVEFLGNVALKDEDYDARGSAVYLLGTIGGEKARSVLFRVLKGK